MIFVIFSRLFCTLSPQTTKPTMTVIAMNRSISPGFASIALNTPEASSELMPLKVPEANLTA